MKSGSSYERHSRWMLSVAGAGDDAQLKATAQGFAVKDWEEIGKQARRHQIAPILIYRLGKRGLADSVPQNTLEYLRREASMTLARNTRIQFHLRELLKALSESHIDVTVLKGAYMAECVYDHPGLRPMNDFDIWVRRADADQLMSILASLGYHSSSKSPGEVQDKEMLFVHGKSGVQLDCHFELASEFSQAQMDMEEIWQERIQTPIAGVTTHILGIEDSLLFLCNHHLMQHNLNLSRSLVDIYQLLNRIGQELDWDRLFDKARRWDCMNCLLLCLRLVVDLMGYRPPGKVGDMVRDENNLAESANLASVLLLSPASSVDRLSMGVVKIFTARGGSKKLRLVKKRSRDFKGIWRRDEWHNLGRRLGVLLKLLVAILTFRRRMWSSFRLRMWLAKG